LQAGLYQVQIQMYDEQWGFICYKETEATVLEASASNRNQLKSTIPNIHLFPNPAEESVNIRVFDYVDEPTELRIVNQLGKVVFRQDNALQSNGVATIDLTSFTNGLYFVQLNAKGRRLVTKKLLVSKLY